MERDLNSEQPSPSVLCRSGCGFYGCPASEGFCSKCFKDVLKRKNDVPTPSVSSVRNSPPASPVVAVLPTLQHCDSETHPASTSTKADDTAECKVEPTKAEFGEAKSAEKKLTDEATLISTAEKEVVKPEGSKKPNRCHVCRKKIGLTGFNCRCNGMFCSEHRYSDKHNCTFDYKTLGQQEIRKNNPAVVAEKIVKL